MGQRKPAHLRRNRLHKRSRKKTGVQRLRTWATHAFFSNTSFDENYADNFVTLLVQCHESEIALPFPFPKDTRLSEVKVMIAEAVGIPLNDLRLYARKHGLLQKDDATIGDLGSRERTQLLVRCGDNIEDIDVATLVLDLDANATQEEIIASYRELSLTHHPNTNTCHDKDAVDEMTGQFRAIHGAMKYMIGQLSRESELTLTIIRGQSTLSFQVRSTDSICHVLNEVTVMEGVTPSGRFLFFNDKALDEDKTLSDYDITRDSTLYFLQDQAMQVFVKTSDGTITLNVTQTTSIAALKDAISEKTVPYRENLRLEYRGKVLCNDSQTVVGCNILSESTLYLLEGGLNGGGGGDSQGKAADAAWNFLSLFSTSNSPHDLMFARMKEIFK